MIILDGTALSQKIIEDLKAKKPLQGRTVVLGAVIVGVDMATASFIKQKKKVAESIGVEFREYRYDPSITTNELRKRIAVIVHEADPDGLIIQLPLPKHINTRYILDSVPLEKDVDMLSTRAFGLVATGKAKILPPVVGAIKVFLEEYRIECAGKHVVIAGAGELVGKPAQAWFSNQGATVSIVRSTTPNIREFTERADIIVSGVGKPKLITGDMVKGGVAVFDAGTSESEGELSGDVDFESVSKKAAYITPVPGGIGPVTAAILFKNLFELAK